MKKVLAIIPLLSFLILIYINKGKYNYSIYFDDFEYKMNLEIADNDEDRQKGLMYRDKLNKDSGMIFIFDHPKCISFWMKNTIISLDIIFINEDMEIVAIKENATPYSLSNINYCTINYDDPIEIDRCIFNIDNDKEYKKFQTKYVIELRAGTVKRHNIKLGYKLKKLK